MTKYQNKDNIPPEKKITLDEKLTHKGIYFFGLVPYMNSTKNNRMEVKCPRTGIGVILSACKKYCKYFRGATIKRRDFWLCGWNRNS